MDDDAIRILVTRLGRAHPSGGTVVERAQIMAEGAGAKDVMTWITAHGGVPEELVAKVNNSGLHGLPARDAADGSGRERLAARIPRASRAEEERDLDAVLGSERRHLDDLRVGQHHHARAL